MIFQEIKNAKSDYSSASIDDSDSGNKTSPNGQDDDDISSKDQRYMNTIERNLNKKIALSKKKGAAMSPGGDPNMIEILDTFRAPNLTGVSFRHNQERWFTYKDHLKNQFAKNKRLQTDQPAMKIVFELQDSGLTSMEELGTKFVKDPCNDAVHNKKQLYDMISNFEIRKIH